MVPAWIAYGHSFAAADVHEQALSAYTTAYRYSPGYAFTDSSRTTRAIGQSGNQRCV